MATNNNITTTELDFDNIKSNFKAFLRGQADLTDYDFEGSGLSILLDVLSYNTHYNALYTNLAVNESFLDSAVKRDSVVSRAFELGYLPRSATTARAIVNITISNVSGNPTTLVLSELTPFTTMVNGTSYVFYTDASYTTINTAGNYVFRNVALIEGTPLTQSYIVSDSARYQISNTNCDISTLTVTVRDSANSSVVVPFNRAVDILSVTSTDAVFFLKEIENGQYEIQFGNGRIGKAVTNGNVIQLSYVVSSKGAANGAKAFACSLLGQSVISTVAPSSGGADPETIEDIKHNAPLSFSASNRAVTSNDYKSILLSNFPNIESIQVWGGDESIPPSYGKVFISIAPKSSLALSINEKSIIKEEILKSRKMVSITPEFVDPFYLNINLNTTIYYDSKLTPLSAPQLISNVTNNILAYNETDLKKFESVFRYSKVLGIIDASDQAITSNITYLTVSRSVSPRFNVEANYVFHINNPLYYYGVPEDAVLSNGFYVSNDANVQYLTDDGVGNIQRFIVDSSNHRVVTNANQGTVDYYTGSVHINSMNIVNLANPEFTFTMKLQSNDIASVREHIVKINPLTLNVMAVADTNAVNSRYIFTPSR